MEVAKKNNPCPFCGPNKEAIVVGMMMSFFSHKVANFVSPDYLKIGDKVTI